MGKRMDFKAYGKLNVILWEEFSYGKINVILWEKKCPRFFKYLPHKSELTFPHSTVYPTRTNDVRTNAQS